MRINRSFNLKGVETLDAGRAYHKGVETLDASGAYHEGVKTLDVTGVNSGGGGQ
jgi:hypothetical protein